MIMTKQALYICDSVDDPGLVFPRELPEDYFSPDIMVITVVFAASPLNDRYVGKDPELQHHNTFWEVTCLDADLLERLAQEKEFPFVGESRDPQ
jgi:hypothetical protein